MCEQQAGTGSVTGFIGGDEAVGKLGFANYTAVVVGALSAGAVAITMKAIGCIYCNAVVLASETGVWVWQCTATGLASVAQQQHSAAVESCVEEGHDKAH